MSQRERVWGMRCWLESLPPASCDATQLHAGYNRLVLFEEQITTVLSHRMTHPQVLPYFPGFGRSYRHFHREKKKGYAVDCEATRSLLLEWAQIAI